MNGDLILIIPILLILVAIMFLVRHMRGGSDDSIAALIGIVPIVIIIGVAIGIIVSMASIADPWEWDADSKTLTIDGNIHDTGLSYPWTGYADQVETLVIEPGVDFIQGPAFARMTSLGHVSIADGVELDDDAFSGTSFRDPYNSEVTDLGGYDYYGFGDRVLYQVDESIYTINSSGRVDLAADRSTVINAVLPSTISGTAVSSLVQYAFQQGPLEHFIALDGLQTIEYRAFYQCGSLEKVKVPDTLKSIAGGTFQSCVSIQSMSFPTITTLGNSTFGGCTSLETITFEGLPQTLGYSVFQDCTSLVSLTLPEGVVSTEGSTFAGCTSLKTVVLPNSMTALGYSAFNGCTGIEKIKFGTGLTTVSTSFPSWTFYASDGTTQLDKSDASNLAGKTFEGTAAALIEVTPGLRTLTPQQIQQVHLHDAELERIKLEAISIDPLPFELQDA